jgi:hypothetical protein
MRVTAVVLAALAAAACARVEAAHPSVEVEMRNVDLHMAQDVTVHVRHLRGRFVATRPSRGPYLDDTSSYQVVVDAGQTAIDLPSLNAIIVRALGHDRSNVRKLRVEIDDEGNLRQRGTLDKAIDLPFSAKSGVEPTPDGRIRVHTRSVRGFGIPLTPLLKAFRVGLDDLVKVEPGHGIAVSGNDLILDPATLLPPPAMRGAIRDARIEGNLLIQTFGSGPAPPLSPPASARNFIYWRGGQLSFGKLTMNETDLELVDNDPRDPFDFSVEHWNDQLVSGYSKTTSRRGLKAIVPDYNDLPAARH